MLGAKNVAATVAVKDLTAAKRFYEGKLKLKPAQVEGDEAVTYQSGKSQILVYQSQYAGSNQATAATWGVGDDIEKVVQELKTEGIKFEHYDLPGLSRKGDIHVGGDLKAAWFKDPDGNILALVNG